MPLSKDADSWLRFLRQYGPVPQNDNMYDEQIERWSRRKKIAPIGFEHPYEKDVLAPFRSGRDIPSAVVLTGTAGDGKTFLLKKVWETVGGSAAEWAESKSYFRLDAEVGGSLRRLHFVRDLTGWGLERAGDERVDKRDLLARITKAVLGASDDEVFLLAANDGQLLDEWRRLDADDAAEVHDLFEFALLEPRFARASDRLLFLNLGRGRSTDLFDLALAALLAHPGWEACRLSDVADDEAFGRLCPVRRNLELLGQDMVQRRLRALVELCDANDLHLSVRQILLLLANALLGHPNVKDHLLTPADVPRVLAGRTGGRASLYNNVFGGNLSPQRRESLTVFDYFDRFRVGHETSNRLDGLLVFGASDPEFEPIYGRLMRSDPIFGEDPEFVRAQDEYIEGAEESEPRGARFLDLLVEKRRLLFFRLPGAGDGDAELAEQAEEKGLRLWDLTVFKYAGDYLDRVVRALEEGARVEQRILARLVRGLNRIFVGLFVSVDREIVLAVSPTSSAARVSRLVADRVSVAKYRGQEVRIVSDAPGSPPSLEVRLNPTLSCRLDLTLVRFEFLSRVADGMLPSSFSKECYEDILAFKSRLLAALENDPDYRARADAAVLSLRVLALGEDGDLREDEVEVRRG